MILGNEGFGRLKKHIGERRVRVWTFFRCDAAHLFSLSLQADDRCALPKPVHGERMENKHNAV